MPDMSHPVTIDQNALCDVFDFMRDQAAGMTCREAMLVADLYRSAGLPSWGKLLIEAHAEGDDDPSDLHHTEWLRLEREGKV